jgi:hypothetical protein
VGVVLVFLPHLHILHMAAAVLFLPVLALFALLAALG